MTSFHNNDIIVVVKIGPEAGKHVCDLLFNDNLTIHSLNSPAHLNRIHLISFHITLSLEVNSSSKATTLVQPIIAIQTRGFVIHSPTPCWYAASNNCRLAFHAQEYEHFNVSRVFYYWILVFWTYNYEFLVHLVVIQPPVANLCINTIIDNGECTWAAPCVGVRFYRLRLVFAPSPIYYVTTRVLHS